MPSWIENLLQILSLIRKEFLCILKEPSSRTVLLAPVLVQSILFGYGATFDLNHIDYAVLDLSHSNAARELLARLEGTGAFARVASLDSTSQLAHTIDSGQALIALSIPADFEVNLNAQRNATVQLILDGRNSTTAGMAASHFATIISGYNRARGAEGNAIHIKRRAWFNPNLESRWNIMPGLIATLSMLQTLSIAALSVAREREQGTFDQLLVTPLTPMQILIGKAIPAILIGLLQSTLILLVVRFWFGIPMAGSLISLYLGLLSFTVAAVGIGLSISALSLTMQQAMLHTFLLLMPLMLLSGLITPVRNMPQALQIATWINPLRFGLTIVRRIYLEGASLNDVAIQFMPLLSVAALTLPLAAWLFRHRLS